MSKSKKKYWYHISYIWLGETYTLTPRIPDSSMATDEPNVKRVCVSDTVQKCVLSLSHRLRLDESIAFYVYRTKKKLKATKCYGVVDSHVTDEHWLLHEADFKFFGGISNEECRAMYNVMENNFGLKTQCQKCLELLNEIISYK